MSLAPKQTYLTRPCYEVLFRQFLRILDLKILGKEKEVLINHPAAAFLKLIEMSAMCLEQAMHVHIGSDISMLKLENQLV